MASTQVFQCYAVKLLIPGHDRTRRVEIPPILILEFALLPTEFGKESSIFFRRPLEIGVSSAGWSASWHGGTPAPIGVGGPICSLLSFAFAAPLSNLISFFSANLPETPKFFVELHFPWVYYEGETSSSKKLSPNLSNPLEGGRVQSHVAAQAFAPGGGALGVSRGGQMETWDFYPGKGFAIPTSRVLIGPIGDSA